MEDEDAKKLLERVAKLEQRVDDLEKLEPVVKGSPDTGKRVGDPG